MIVGIVALLACQLIANAYSGGLASIMAVPQYVLICCWHFNFTHTGSKHIRFQAPIKTAHQLAESNMGWGATRDAWIFSILDATPVDEFE